MKKYYGPLVNGEQVVSAHVDFGARRNDRSFARNQVDSAQAIQSIRRRKEEVGPTGYMHHQALGLTHEQEIILQTQ